MARPRPTAGTQQRINIIDGEQFDKASLINQVGIEGVPALIKDCSSRVKRIAVSDVSIYLGISKKEARKLLRVA